MKTQATPASSDSPEANHNLAPRVCDGHELLCLNQRLAVYPFDDGDVRKKFLYELPDATGRARRVTVTEQAHEWLQLFDGNTSVDSVMTALVNAGNSSEQVDRFRLLVNDFFLPRNILATPDKADEPTPLLKARPSYMSAKIRLLTARQVNPLTRILQGAFDFWPAGILLTLALIGQAYFYSIFAGTLTQSFPQLDSATVIGAFFIVLLGVIAHEFGHAAAAYRYGCRNVDIGVGWYIYFMVFYANLSEAWRCTRRQRAVIDASGMFFQAAFVAEITFLHWLSPDPAFFYGALVLNVVLLLNLNPFFRMDGYWLVCDLLGVSNLRRAATATSRAWLSRLLRKPATHNPADNLKGKKGLWLMAYTLCSTLFFLWVFYFIATELIWTLLTNIPRYADKLGTLLQSSPTTSDVIVTAGGLIGQLLVLYFVVYFVTRVIYRLASLRRLAATSN